MQKLKRSVESRRSDSRWISFNTALTGSFLLEEQAEPVKDSINQDRNRVFEVLNTKSYKDAKFNRYLELFKEIMDGAEHCNNVSTLRSYADKAEALKLRLLNEMNAEDIRLVQEAAAKAEAERKRQEEEAKKRGETVKPAEKVAEPQPVYKVRTTKNVSIKTVARLHRGGWRVRTTLINTLPHCVKIC